MNHPRVYKCPLPPEPAAIFLPKALFRLSQNTALSFQFYTAKSHLLCILHMVMYMFPCFSLNLSNSLCSHEIKRCLLLARTVMTNLVQFSSVAQICLTLCDPMNCSMTGFPVHHQLPEFTQIHVHWVGDAVQPSHPLSPPSPPALNRSQHQGLFKWLSPSHQVAKVLDFQLQHQFFQRTPRTDLL